MRRRDRTITGPLKGGQRESSFVINKALGNGLSPDPRVPRNMPYLETMQNMRPIGYAAVTPEELSDPITNGPTPNWSSAGTVQMFRGEVGRWVMGQTQGYSADASWAASTVGATFSAGTHPWRAVFFEDIPFFTNSDVFLWGTDLARVTTPTIRAIGKHENRLLLGGMAGTVFSSDVFGRVFQDWKDTAKDDRFAYAAQAWDTSWMMFGERAGGSSDRPFDAMLSLLDLYTSQNQADFEGYLKSELENYQWGMARLRYPGYVQAFHELDEGPIVFGENGVARLMQQGELYHDKRIARVGISAPGCVGGDLHALVYLNSNRELYRLDSGEVRPRRLNFSHHLANLTLADVTISYDSQEGIWWIADKTAAWTLDDDGRLGGPMEIVPSSVVRESGALYAVFNDTRSDQTKRTVSITTLPIDIAERGKKTLQVLQVSRSGIDALKGSMDVRYDDEETTFLSGTLTDATPDGNIFPLPKLQFADGKVKLQGTVTNGTTGVLDRIRVSYQADDISYLRGARGVPEGD